MTNPIRTKSKVKQIIYRRSPDSSRPDPEPLPEENIDTGLDLTPIFKVIGIAAIAFVVIKILTVIL